MKAIMITIWLILASASVVALFNISFQVADMEKRLRNLNHQIELEKVKIHTLKAEWANATRPALLTTMGNDVLPQFQRLSPEKVMTIEDIPFYRPQPAKADAESGGATASLGRDSKEIPE